MAHGVMKARIFAVMWGSDTGTRPELYLGDERVLAHSA